MSTDGSRHSESCHHAPLQGPDSADPIASYAHHDQAERVGDATYRAEEIEAECGLSVRTSRDEPEALALAERTGRKPPFGRLLTLVFERIRWHPQPHVVSQQRH